MSNKRLEILAQIVEDEKIRKMAQEAGAGPDEVDQATADQLAQDIFEKLFNEEMNKIVSQS